MSIAGSADRSYVIVANRWAGSGRAHGLIGAVEAALGHTPSAVVEPDLTPAFAQRLNAALVHARESSTGASRPLLVCIGGDGTLSLAFDALHEPGAAVLAAIPCGSGNDFALTLGIGSRAQALDLLRHGVERRIDFGTVGGRRFLNCVGLGLDAEVAAMAARIRARGLAKGFSYYLAALRGLLSIKPVGATVRTPATTMRFDDLVMITIGNGAWYGGGFRGAPDARLDDGMLDCYAFRDVPGVLRRLALMQRIRAGVHPSEPNVTALRTNRLGIAFDRVVAMHVDGELGQVQETEIAMVPGGAMILAPVTTSTTPKDSKTTNLPVTACTRGTAG
jgi:diacylglycerol kinase (ATP)